MFGLWCDDGVCIMKIKNKGIKKKLKIELELDPKDVSALSNLRLISPRDGYTDKPGAMAALSLTKDAVKDTYTLEDFGFIALETTLTTKTPAKTIELLADLLRHITECCIEEIGWIV